MQTARQAIADAQGSANEETKSSAGDKYETGRAMAQLEIEKNSAQITAMQEQLKVLRGIDTSSAKNTVQSGSIVYTDQGNFFISVAAGPLSLEGETFYAISLGSPIAKVLAGRVAGETVIFQGKEYHIGRVQ